MIWFMHLISLVALAASMPLSDSEASAWNLVITQPNGLTTWYTGQKYLVEWNIPTRDVDVKHTNGVVYISGIGTTRDDLYLLGGFDLQKGQVEVQVPDDMYIPPYQEFTIDFFVLPELSHHYSQQFTILQSE